MEQDFAERLDLAVSNLLQHCAGLFPGQKLLIVGEEPGAGYYDDLIAGAVARIAAARGLDVDVITVPFLQEVPDLDVALVARMASVDCTVFFARLADQIRFRELPGGTRAVVSYALDLQSFASNFGTADYRAFVALKLAVDKMMMGAQEIRVTCPRGTDFSGPGLAISAEPKIDVGIIRFPMSIFAPVAAQNFSGRAVLAGFLVGTGSRYYHPYGRALSAPIAANFTKGRLTGFSGGQGDVALANHHYDDIAARFDLDRNAVHSWHAGIHPGCAFTTPADQDFLRWSGSAFGNPRLLHFHTCGLTPPGEISLNILDPTILVDGVAVWQEGRFLPQLVPEGVEILERYPSAAATFQCPARDVGIPDSLPGLPPT